MLSSVITDYHDLNFTKSKNLIDNLTWFAESLWCKMLQTRQKCTTYCSQMSLGSRELETTSDFWGHSTVNDVYWYGKVIQFVKIKRLRKYHLRIAFINLRLWRDVNTTYRLQTPKTLSHGLNWLTTSSQAFPQGWKFYAY